TGSTTGEPTRVVCRPTRASPGHAQRLARARRLAPTATVEPGRHPAPAMSEPKGIKSMSTIPSPRVLLAALCAPLAALRLAAAGTTAVVPPGAAAARASDDPPIVKIDGGDVRGAIVSGGYAFRGLPYAAPPTGTLRWRAPEPPADWKGVRDATEF